MRNAADASSISRRVKQMYTGLQEKSYVKAEIENVGYLKLRGRGDLYFRNSSREGSRSLDSVSSFLFDECAFIHNIEQIYAASSPSAAMVGDDVTKLIVSTPSAKQGWYWSKLSQDNGDKDIEQICEAVAAGELYNDDLPGLYYFKDEAGVLKLILHWKSHPTYSQIDNYLEYRQQQDGSDLESTLREYDLKFIDSAVSVFNADLIRSCAIGELESSQETGAKYYVGVDSATTGSDYFCAVVIKEKSSLYQVINVYRKRGESSNFNLYKVGELIKQYQPKRVVIETTGGVGQVVMEQLVREFKNVDIEGFHTSQTSKQTLISNIILAMEQRRLLFPGNSILVEELSSFVRKGNRLEAASGRHDDSVLALGFALSGTPFTGVEKVNPRRLNVNF